MMATPTRSKTTGPECFAGLVAEVTAHLDGRPLDAALMDWLNAEHPPGSPLYDALREQCIAGADQGWMCQREAGGIRYGRVIKAGPDTHGFSVDVVDMEDVVGPYHRHPHGEIDLVMPIDAAARFDGQGAGWRVYGPGTAHPPTVSGGRALVLYLLPEGAIDFSARPGA